ARAARKHTGVRMAAAKTTRISVCLPGIGRWHRRCPFPTRNGPHLGTRHRNSQRGDMRKVHGSGTNVRKMCVGLFALACCALAPGTIAFAQETINQATISGRVLDAQGAPVPGAAVSGRQTDTNVTVQAITDTDGRFRFPYLKIGPYELEAKLQGFKDNARTLVLSAGSAFDISISLEIAGIDTAVTVVADSRVLETARSQI